ncbi:hypothetical protein C2R22_23430 (plasmid) [Salinigranum rubrum]|uniref:Uncharacterized protein n=1 Tax=Salinigranum rubrum TaxID=755307 RepID=A0A2I8VRE6_9EURY|nr:hypothetical protein [Salinigranum rubrum]AUV84500.1 hypothetical protein C2R22_23430 [Salinigranum rubrum]
MIETDDTRKEVAEPFRTDETPTESSLRNAGRAALLSLTGLVLSWIFGILFLTSGGIYAPLSDLGSLVYKLPLVVVAWILYRIYRPTAPAVSRAVFALGVAGIGVSVVAGVGLAANDLGAPVGTAGAFLAGQRIGSLVVGIWLLAVSGQELLAKAFDRRVAVAGIVAGSGMVLLQSSLLIGGVGHPGFGLGSIVQLTGTLLWSIWIGRRFLAGWGALRSASETTSAD